MDKDGPHYFSCFTKRLSSVVHSFWSFQHFNSKTHLLSYLLLCVVKMPFIPPVSIARSVSGLTRKESNSSVSTANKLCREDRGSLVKERITLNLKQLGKKSQASRSGLSTAKGGTEAKRRDKLSTATPKLSESIITTGSAVEPTPSWSSVKAGSEVKSRVRVQEEAHFTLTLTPEAVLLLQRRNSERHQKANRSNSSAANSGGATDSRPNGRRRENPSKRHQSSQRRSTSGNRVTPKSSSDAELDIRSILKISLLNERHKYDDVEYEEEDDCGVDQRVVLKCTEWLRGLESPLTGGGVCKGSGKSC